MQGLVGARVWDDRSIRIYRRQEGVVVAETLPYQPWLAVGDPSLIEGDGVDASSMTSLSGDEGLRTLVRFQRWPLAWEAIHRALSRESERRHQRLSSYLELPGIWFLAEPVEQWLAASGAAFYTGLSAHTIVRLQIAIETAAPPGRPSRSDRAQDRILTIAATVNDGRKSTFRLRKNDEAALLREFLGWFDSVDPDVVEGFELQSHVLPYIAERCALLGFEPTLGREETLLRLAPSTIGKGPWEIPGRCVLDPVEALRHAGPTIQALLLGSNSTRRAASPSGQPTPVRRCQDVRRRSDVWWDHLLPLIATVPLPPDRTARTGPGHWLEAWLIGRAVQTGSAIPASSHATSPPAEPSTAGTSGTFAPAAELVLMPLKATAWRRLGDEPTSAMPSWIQSVRAQWEPHLAADAGDATGTGPIVATALLTGLTDAVRARASRLHVPGVAERLDRMIGETAADAAKALRTQNVEVIQEVGERLYVEYPDNLSDDEHERVFWTKVDASLPPGLRAVTIRRFASLVSLAPRIMHGWTGTAAVALPRPQPVRTAEAYIRDFHAVALPLILQRQWNRLHELTIETARRIKARSWHVAEFCRRETLAGSLTDYVRERDARRRNPAAPYEALLRAQESAERERAGQPDVPVRRPVHDAGSTVVYYIAGNRRDLSLADMSRLAEYWDPDAPDENTEYYLERLRQSLERYQPLFPEGDFSRIFGEESLFSFRDDEIVLVRRPFAGIRPAERPPAGTPGIWLDLSEA